MRALSRQRGQSLVELTLILPVLLLVVLVTVDLGRAYFDYISILAAAENGVKVASHAAKTDAEITNAVVSEPDGTITISPSSVTISPSPTRASGQQVTVTVERPFVAVTPFVSSIWGGGPLNIRVSATGPVM